MFTHNNGFIITHQCVPVIFISPLTLTLPLAHPPSSQAVHILFLCSFLCNPLIFQWGCLQRWVEFDYRSMCVCYQCLYHSTKGLNTPPHHPLFAYKFSGRHERHQSPSYILDTVLTGLIL